MNKPTQTHYLPDGTLVSRARVHARPRALHAHVMALEDDGSIDKDFFVTWLLGAGQVPLPTVCSPDLVEYLNQYLVALEEGGLDVA